MRYSKRSTVLTSLRAKALGKLTQLSLNNSEDVSKDPKDRNPLYLIAHSLPAFYSTDTSKLYTIPLNLNEWEVLISLSSATVNNAKQAQQLLRDVIASYFINSPRQRFTDVLIGKFKQEHLRQPNEVLTFQLAKFLLSLSNKFPELTRDCLELIEQYLDLIAQIYTQKSSALFSLIGFTNAFIHDVESASIELGKFIWTKFNTLLNNDEFFKNIDNILTTSPNFNNDTMVQYFEAGQEICVPFFIKLMAHFEVSLVNRILNNSISQNISSTSSLSKRVLEIKNMEYSYQQNPSEFNSDNLDVISSFKIQINENKDLLTEICQNALVNSSRNDNLDFSSDLRIKFSFDAKSYFLELLCLIPYVESSNGPLFSEFSKLVSNLLENFLLTDYISSNLIKTIVTIASFMNFFTEENSLMLLRMFPLLIASDHISTDTVYEISKSFTVGLYPLNEDAIVNTIYSINNMLAVTDSGIPSPMIRERHLTVNSRNSKTRERTMTADTMEEIKNFKPPSAQNTSGKTEINAPNSSSSTCYHELLFKNCVRATITITSKYNDPAITALTTTILTQKVNVISIELDKIIMDSLAMLAPFTTPSEFSLLLKFHRLVITNATKDGNNELLKSIIRCKTTISRELKTSGFTSELFKLHLYDLLDIIIASGESEHKESRTDSEISHVAGQIGSYLIPLAALLPGLDSIPLDISTDETYTNMFRNVWFNMVIHGFYYEADFVKSNHSYLATIAHSTPPLASDFPSNKKEMSIDMNSILRRGSSSSNVKKQKTSISDYLSSKSVQPRSISTPKIMFLAATVLLETIRCDAGDCSKVLLYFSNSSIVSSFMEKNIDLISFAMIRKFTKAAQSGKLNRYSARAIAKQLNNMLLLLCNKSALLQNAAFKSCELFIKTIPSSLCHHQSLYTLLDLMTALFDGIIDCETNKFEPHYEFYLKHFNTKVTFPSSISWRRATLTRLLKSAREWVRFVLNKSSQDSKILLQSYISDLNQMTSLGNIECGVSFAIEMAGTILPVNRELSRLSYTGGDKPNTIASFLSQQTGRSKHLIDKAIASSPHEIFKEIDSYTMSIRNDLANGDSVSEKTILNFLDLSAALIIHGSIEASSLIHNVVHIPFEVFTSSTIKAAINIWSTIMKERSDLAHILLVDVGYCWMRTINENKGLYSRSNDLIKEEFQMMEYKPYNKKAINRNAKLAIEAFEPHRQLTGFLSSYFESTLFQSGSLLKLFTSWVLLAVNKLNEASLHPFARMIRNELLIFATSVLIVNYRQNSKYIYRLCDAISNGALSWFKTPLSWPFGANELRNKSDLAVALELSSQLGKVSGVLEHYCNSEYKVLQYALQSEIFQMRTWLSPLDKVEGGINSLSTDMLNAAVELNPKIAINILQGQSNKKHHLFVSSMISKNPLKFVGVAEALDIFLEASHSTLKADLHYVTYWCPTTPLKSINLFLQRWNRNPFVLQYAVHSLEHHDVNVTFFYVPQIVQCLRYDNTGYVERLILDTAMINVLFSHQIIWNMLANCYKGDEGLIEDEIKPTLDRVRERLVSKFSKSHKEFYEREFKFFNEVTGISGKLKPYIKKSKAEKKQKIDEEMAKIAVESDVYLPSNPDGVVIDINRKSGKPLQSHAKAPFMATFKIKKEVESENGRKASIEKWQAAIFKVGDDCRQDVLALQLISMFRTIWSNIGLDVYVYPYRVTATAPGCGVIDVLPKSISRDMLGREAVNELYEYFISKFGNENTFEFQNARNNLVKSLAGYSVISYLLQFKDRHNGNIMYDDQGHCLHIDFGFIFDIVPGGVKFEAVPFKLTKEMVNVMGGSQDTQAYRDFEELCIKAYLAARPHMEAILECVEPMLGSGLPCFKGSKTMKNLENRFQPNKTEHEAATFMKSLIKKSYESIFTKGYDEFQRLTNGIPY